ncbi:MAG: hypothetical protein J6S67_13710 [Methanobrevibacter sp.]|nr:hypothetical protein [Methanobrevibacter sp.]
MECIYGKSVRNTSCRGCNNRAIRCHSNCEKYTPKVYNDNSIVSAYVIDSFHKVQKRSKRYWRER